MTKINYMHGIPQNEMGDRGQNVKGQPFIPYASLSQGEMRVSLAAERAQILAQAYPDLPEYSAAAALLKNALNAGVSNGISFVGALYDPVLQSAAAIIAKAKNQTRPASVAGFISRPTLAKGVPYGASIGAFTEVDCIIYARDKSNAFYGKNEGSGWWQSKLRKPMYRNRFKSFQEECVVMNAVQQVVNERIESSSHHVLYKSVNDKFPGLNGTRMDTKRLDHVASIGGLALLAYVSDSKLIDEWTENGILRYNAQTVLGAMPSPTASFYIAANEDPSVVNNYLDWQQKEKISGIGEPITLTVAGVTALVTAIGKSLADAAKFQQLLNEKRNSAAQVAKGYGTKALSAQEGDFGIKKTPGGGSQGISTNTMLIAAAAAAGLILFNK